MFKCQYAYNTENAEHDTKPGERMVTFAVLRPNKSIARIIPVCTEHSIAYSLKYPTHTRLAGGK